MPESTGSKCHSFLLVSGSKTDCLFPSSKVPKTDYTYSKLSPHRRELADGFVSMPNMSRSSVNRHEERVSHMIRSNPDQESYIRQRYQHVNAGSFASNSDYRNLLISEDNTARSAASFEYDSQDEVDVVQFEQRRAAYSSRVVRQHQETLIRRVFVTIITTLTSFWHKVTRVFSRSEHNLYYTRLEEKKGGFLKASELCVDGTNDFFNFQVGSANSLRGSPQQHCRCSGTSTSSFHRFYTWTVGCCKVERPTIARNAFSYYC
jgi:hypothetical protein